MGWNTAGEIFNPVASAICKTDLSDGKKTEILERLIWALQDGDWDTEDESVEIFMNEPAVIQAFRNRGVYIPCKCTCCRHEAEMY